MKKSIAYDELLKVIPNKYILTIIGGKRARELSKGMPCFVKTGKKDTTVKKALEEIEEGKITYEISDKVGE